MTLSNVVAHWSPTIQHHKVRRVVVLPFVNRSEDPTAGFKVAHLVFRELQRYGKYEVQAPDEESMDHLPLSRNLQAGSSVGQMSLEIIQKRLRKRLQRVLRGTAGKSGETLEADVLPDVDAVVTGLVLRYRDKEGGALAVDQPASVAYDAVLVNLRNGVVLWLARYAETQQALLDNLLKMGRFLKGGGVWQSSDTLARLGTERVVRTFPSLQDVKRR